MAMVTMERVQPFMDSMPAADKPEVLRDQAQRDGYLFFRGMIEPEALGRVRRQVLEVVQKHGGLDPDAPLEEAIAKEGVQINEGPNPAFQAMYSDILKLRDFHALAQHPNLLHALQNLFGEQVLAHSRNICRVVFPGTARFTTPPHQDHLYIGGTQNTWTTWIPLGGCPEEMGGLAVAPGSHKLGFLPTEPAEGAGGRQVKVPDDAVWAWNPFEQGDVLLLNSLCIHQARDNREPRKIRVSVDYRYQPVSEPIRPDSMKPHMGGFGMNWDKIYEDWPENDPVKYYWKDLELNYTDD